MKEIMDVIQGRGSKDEQLDVMHDLVYGVLLTVLTALATKLAAELTKRILGERG